MAANGLSCYAWITSTGTAKTTAGIWKADGVDEDGLTKYKVVADNTEVTEAMWKAEAGYNASGCPEVEAAENGAEAENDC